MITSDPSNLLKLLGDPTRLRILALVDREELSVGELSQSLGMA
ncbi:MAG: DNA-binding transcriptional ArsR family regulator, partial [Planctomycetota bacterium]